MLEIALNFVDELGGGLSAVVIVILAVAYWLKDRQYDKLVTDRMAREREISAEMTENAVALDRALQFLGRVK